MLFQNSQTKSFKEGQIITWGTGALRAKVLEVKPSTLKIELMCVAEDPASGKKFNPGYVDEVTAAICRHLS